MKTNLLLKMMLAALLILWGGLGLVYAQAPDDREEPPVLGPGGQLSLSLKQLGYGPQTINRDNPERFYRIDLPDNFKLAPTGNYIQLITSHFPPIPDRPAVLRVVTNEGRLVSSVVLTQSNATSNTLRIDLPEGLLKPGYNFMIVSAETDEPCGDVGSLLDVVVDENSTINFNYQQLPYPTDLALYPFPFVTNQRNRLFRIPTTLVLPDSPTAQDLSAAATLAAGLGQLSGGRINLTTVLAGKLDPETRAQNHLIIIGRPESNSVLRGLKLPLPITGGTVSPGQGVLQEVISPWNEYRLALVVSGLDDAGVAKAAFALNRQAHFLGMRGPVAVVLDLRPLTKPDISQGTTTTLGSLGYDDQIVYGVKPKTYDYDFDLPLGWRLEDLPYLVLKFSHADILDPNQSMIDVRLNEVPIGSGLLDKNNVTEGQLTISLPRRLLQAGRNRLTVGVEMDMPNSDKCQDANAQRAWTVISRESEIFLPYNTVNVQPDLKLLPYPFSQVDGFDQTLFVLPDQPSPQTFDDLMRLAILLGSPSRAEYISAYVDYAAAVKPEVAEKHHLILLGRPSQNALLAEVNDYLPHPFVAGSDLLKPLVVDSISFMPDPKRDAGLVEIATSPWNENRSLLAVTGTTDQGYRLAIETLLQGEAQLQGNLAVIEPSTDPFATQPTRISTYSIDTRPPQPDQASADAGHVSESDLPTLAGRWWK